MSNGGLFTLSPTRIGMGTYGKVFRGRRNGSAEEVAVKCFRSNAAREGIDVGILRELVYLKSLPPHPNIVQLYDIDWSTASTIRVSMPLYECDLSRFVKRRGGLPVDLVMQLSRQVLEGLQHVHRYGVFHRDIKPGNLLLRNCDDAAPELVICDFSLASNFVNKIDHSNTIQTLWYRAPEILLGATSYTESVDIWSWGCVVGMMCRGRDLFVGDCEIGQLYKIFRALGTPTPDDWPGLDKLPNAGISFWPQWHPTDEETNARLIGSATECEPLLDAMRRALVLEPSGRASAAQLLAQ